MPPRNRVTAAPPLARPRGIEAFTKPVKPGAYSGSASAAPKNLKRKIQEESAADDGTSAKRKRLHNSNASGLPSPHTTPDEDASSVSAIFKPDPGSQAKEDLIQLHRALLRALSLHLAHHGTSSPIRLSDLLPSASKIWGSRQITAEDVQRCLAQYDMTAPPLRIWDYGRAGTCLELSASVAQRPAQGKAVLASAIDEGQMCNTFETNLEAAWLARCDAGQASDDFVAHLPMVKITQHPSLLKSHTASASIGQQRLDDMLKTPRRLKEQAQAMTPTSTGLLTPAHTDTEPMTPSSGTASTPTSKSSTLTAKAKSTPQERKISLYARLAAKSRASPSKPTASTTPTDGKQRREFTPAQTSALSHLPGICSILAVLSASSGGRQAFSLVQLVRRVKESSHSVIEESVVREAVGLLGGVRLDDKGKIAHAGDEGSAEERGLAPDFVKVVRIGEGVVGVVVVAGGRPDDLDERIRRAREQGYF